MARVNNVLYLTDDIIYLKNKNRKDIIKYNINKNIIIEGKIANIDKFIKAYEKLLNENNLNNNLFGDTIKIIIRPNYTFADISLLKTVFEKFNYRKITIDNETKYYKLNNSNAYLNIFNNYIILTYIDEYKKTNSFVIPANYFNNNTDTFKYIKSKIANKDIYIIGKGEVMNEVFSLFESIYQNKTYIYSNHETYLLDNSKY